MLGMDNITKFEKSETEMELLNRQYLAFRKTKKYKRAKENGMRDASPKKQLFFGEFEVLYESFMIEKGLRIATEGDRKASDKESLMTLVTDALPQMETVLDFRMLSTGKAKSAIRTTSGDYELSFTIHKNPIVEVKQGVEIVGKLHPHVEEIANLLTKQDNGVVRIKNNQITFDKDDVQMSLSIVKKKKELF